jgi:uncharacterized protein (TIGR03083 family)
MRASSWARLTGMDTADHLDHLHADGLVLAEAARAAGFEAEVPACPSWLVRDLVRHVGVVHRWAQAIVGGPLDRADEVRVQAPDADTPDEVMLAWFVDGHRNLVQTLRDAPSDLNCFTLPLPCTSPLEFWARRQAHETAIHRADAEAANAGISRFDDDFALDGIDEMLVGLAPRPRPFEPAGLRIEPAGGPSWLLRFGPNGLTSRPDSSTAADATVTGTPGDIYLWVWNRPADVTVSGDPTVAQRWRRIRVRRN